MAMRVLTMEEKLVLKDDTTFRQCVEEAILNYASYWSTNTGTVADNVPDTQTARLKWSKDRTIGVEIMLGGIRDVDLFDKTYRLMKNLQVDLAAAPVAAADIITAMLAASKFEELASLYHDLRGESINMSVGGN